MGSRLLKLKHNRDKYLQLFQTNKSFPNPVESPRWIIAHEHMLLLYVWWGQPFKPLSHKCSTSASTKGTSLSWCFEVMLPLKPWLQNPNEVTLHWYFRVSDSKEGSERRNSYWSFSFRIELETLWYWETWIRGYKYNVNCTPMNITISLHSNAKNLERKSN